MPESPGEYVKRVMGTEQPAASVVDLAAIRQARSGDDAVFLACNRCKAEEFSVVCRMQSGRPFVASLVCASCDPVNEIGVVNGLLDPPLVPLGEC